MNEIKVMYCPGCGKDVACLELEGDKIQFQCSDPNCYYVFGLITTRNEVLDIIDKRATDLVLAEEFLEV